jgi:hypothetical protein
MFRIEGFSIYKFLSITLFLSWIMINIHSIHEMKGLQILGGGMVLFILIPLMLIILFKSKTYQKHVLALTSIIVGYVILNYLHDNNSIYQLRLSPMVMLFISVLPFLFITPPFFWLINERLKDPEQFSSQEDKKLMINIKALEVLLFFMLPLSFGVAIYIFISIGNTTVASKDALDFLLFGFIIGGLIMIIYFRKYKIENMYYILKFSESIKHYSTKSIKRGTLIISFLLIASCFIEIWRGKWLFWFECSLLMFIMAFHLWRFYKPLLCGINEEIIPAKFNLPDITSQRNLTTIILLFIVSWLWVFIIIQTVKN